MCFQIKTNAGIKWKSKHFLYYNSYYKHKILLHKSLAILLNM